METKVLPFFKSFRGQKTQETDRKNSKHSGTILFVSILNPINIEEINSPEERSLYDRTGH